MSDSCFASIQLMDIKDLLWLSDRQEANEMCCFWAPKEAERQKQAAKRVGCRKPLPLPRMKLVQAMGSLIMKE